MEDFEYQLRAEKEYVTSAAATAQTQSTATYIDPTDNTVYAWDNLKKGWFTKCTPVSVLHKQTIF